MCLNPRLIKNKSRFHKRDLWNSYMLDTSSQYIYVNCGVCPQCVRNKQNYLMQRLILESVDNHIYFFTLTYNNEHLPHFSFPDLDIEFDFVDYKDFQRTFDRLRKQDNFLPTKYLIVSEYGGKKHRPHLHGFFLVPKSALKSRIAVLNYEKVLFDMLKEHWSVNVGTRKCPKFEPLFTYAYDPRTGKRNYDLHYVDPYKSKNGEADVGFYVSKYVLKFDEYVDKFSKLIYARFQNSDYPEDIMYSVLKMFKPFIHYSHGFGLSSSSVEYLRSNIDKYKDIYPYPIFVNPQSGKTFPLSPYLFNKVGTLQDRIHFYMNTPSFATGVDFDTNMRFHEDDKSLQNKISKFSRQNRLLSEKY